MTCRERREGGAGGGDRGGPGGCAVAAVVALYAAAVADGGAVPSARRGAAPVGLALHAPVADRAHRADDAGANAQGPRPGPNAEQILELKVCDPAMGSGAFLVEACRFSGDKLKDAWLRFRVAPKVPSDEDLTLHARRVVAQRCLYGVDKNPMAVQLAKLSLWLFTLAKDHPFTFLDHALKCGDSLVGLTRTQIARLTWEDDASSFTTVFTSHVEQLVHRGEALRLQIHDLPDPPDTAELLVLNEAAEASLETARLLGHLAVAAFFQGGNAKAKKERVREARGEGAASVHGVAGYEEPGEEGSERDDGGGVGTGECATAVDV